MCPSLARVRASARSHGAGRPPAACLRLAVRCQSLRPDDRAAERQAGPPAEALGSRRLALASLAALAPALALGSAAAVAAEEGELNAGFPSASAADVAGGDRTVTDRVYLDFGLCPEAVRANRTLGDKTILCLEPEPLGRIVIGLYGKAAPGTVAIFLEVVRSGAYEGSALSKILPGQYLYAGKQGSKRMGLVEPPPGLPSNPDVLSASAFRLRHQRPGTVSLSLSGNEDESDMRFASGYRNTSFLITTGPAPAPYLDDENIVFGQVLEGLDVVRAIEAVPTFHPINDNARAFNDFARVLGDDRANTTRAKWGRPLKAVVITAVGILPP